MYMSLFKGIIRTIFIDIYGQLKYLFIESIFTLPACRCFYFSTCFTKM